MTLIFLSGSFGESKGFYKLVTEVKKVTSSNIDGREVKFGAIKYLHSRNIL